MQIYLCSKKTIAIYCYSNNTVETILRDSQISFSYTHTDKPTSIYVSVSQSVCHCWNVDLLDLSNEEV